MHDAVAHTIQEKVPQIVSQVLEQPEVPPTVSLLQLGASSIELLRIITLLEDAFGFRPDTEEFFQLQTVEALTAFYERHLGQRRMEPEPVLQPLQARWPVLSEPRERRAFLDTRPELRPAPPETSFVPLPIPPAAEPELQRRYRPRPNQYHFSLQPIALEVFSLLLGCLRSFPLAGRPHYLFGPAGTTYGVQTYLYLRSERVQGLAGGTWYYHPEQHRLILLEPGATLDRGVFPFHDRAAFDSSAFSLFLVGRMRALLPLHGEKSRDHALLEAGKMTGLLEAEAPAQGLGLCQVNDLDFSRVRAALRLEDDHLLLHSLLGGLVQSEEGAL